MRQPTAWLLATRPWSFPMSFISVSLGTLWAGLDGISWPVYGLALAGLICLHGATNLINDYYDIRNGVDVAGTPTTRYRPHPLEIDCLDVSRVPILAGLLYLLGVAAGLWLVYLSGWSLLYIGLAGVGLSVFYSADPLSLKYRGLGEAVVFLVWGPLSVSGAYYTQTSTFSTELLFVSVPVGILVSLVLLANNIRDASYDSRQGITTLAVLAGVPVSRVFFLVLLGLVFGSTLLMALVGPLTRSALLTLLVLPPAVRLVWRLFGEIPDDVDARTARIVLLFGLLLVLSIWLGG